MYLTEVGFCFIRMYLPMKVCIRVLAYCNDVGMYMYANVLYRCRLFGTLPMSVCICTCTFLVLSIYLYQRIDLLRAMGPYLPMQDWQVSDVEVVCSLAA